MPSRSSTAVVDHRRLSDNPAATPPTLRPEILAKCADGRCLQQPPVAGSGPVPAEAYPAGERGTDPVSSFNPNSCLSVRASGGYERGWAEALRKARIAVRVDDPRQVRYFAKSAGRLAKNDPIDAEIIARFGETFSLRPSRPTTPSAWRSTGWSLPAAGWSGGLVRAPGEDRCQFCGHGPTAMSPSHSACCARWVSIGCWGRPTIGAAV